MTQFFKRLQFRVLYISHCTCENKEILVHSYLDFHMTLIFCLQKRGPSSYTYMYEANRDIEDL
jgi:hypothetical protein